MATSIRSSLDAELRVGLESYSGPRTASISAEMIPTLRQAIASLSPTDEMLRRGGAVELCEFTVPGPLGGPEVGLLVCRRAGVSGPTAGLFFVHGGGFIAGDNRLGVRGILDWVEKFELTLVSVQYRLAPEHPYPAALEDCYTALCWTASHSADLGIDVQRIVISGVSAGGGLAAGIALRARDRSGPLLRGQLLMSPMLDDRDRSDSTEVPRGDGVWDELSNRTSWTALLGERRGLDVPAHAAPARAADLSRLPVAFVDVGSAEFLCAEDVDYAQRLARAGNLTELHMWPGAFHGFDLLVPNANVSAAAWSARAGWLKRILA